LAQHINCLGLMNHADFSIRTIDEAGQLAAFVAQACPNPETAAMGLSELLINAIEHGNLGLSYTEKTQLKQSDTWHAEIRRRSALPENREKQVLLSFRRNEDAITFRIVDQGKGFAWQSYLDFDPSRAFDPNGRGIALARMLSFSSIRYEGHGNVAVACVDLPYSETGRPQ
jgi:anti-sigma regulatory factor (Ser/Thr protein kinase)